MPDSVVEALLWILVGGASPNVPDTEGWTAVHQAASRGNARIMQAVLEAGGDVHRRDRAQRTPLDVARDRKHGRFLPLMAAKAR